MSIIIVGENSYSPPRPLNDQSFPRSYFPKRLASVISDTCEVDKIRHDSEDDGDAMGLGKIINSISDPF